jgi:hypothetical protein
MILILFAFVFYELLNKTFWYVRFISEFELRMITIKEHQFHEGYNTLLYSRIESYDITKKYGIKLKYVVL